MMATESSPGAGAGGGPPLGTTSTTTPPSTTNPSRQTSARVANDPYSGGAGGRPSLSSAGMAVATAQPPAPTRDVRANSLADPPPPQQPRSTSVAAHQPPPSTSSSTPSNNNNETISYSAERIIGNGSFGVVFQASVVESGEIVAIKKVLQDKRFKNRELQIMRQLVKDGHSNIVALKHCFYSQVSFIFVDFLNGMEGVNM